MFSPKSRSVIVVSCRPAVQLIHHPLEELMHLLLQWWVAITLFLAFLLVESFAKTFPSLVIGGLTHYVTVMFEKFCLAESPSRHQASPARLKS